MNEATPITLPAQTGTAFLLKKNSLLKIIDVAGQQVCDLFCFAQHDLTDALSSGRSIDYNETIFLSVGHKLYANSGKVMFSILEDSCGRHDFLVTPCSQQMFEMITGSKKHHPSCLENLTKNLAPFDVKPEQITTTFNIFMNIQVDPSGRTHLKTPTSKAGDYILLRAEMDLVVGLTACSDEDTNGGSCKPIQYLCD